MRARERRQPTRPQIVERAAGTQAAREDLELDRAPSAHRGARRVFRRFMAGFLHYEVGEPGAAVRDAIRRHATPRFARQLLGSPPRALRRGELPPRAELGARLEFQPLARGLGPRRAIVYGVLRRDGEHSALSFVLVRRDERWLVAGAGGSGGG